MNSTAGCPAAAGRLLAVCKLRRTIWRSWKLSFRWRRGATGRRKRRQPLKRAPAQAEAEIKLARGNWRDALSAAGLPVELSARQVRQLASRWSGMSDAGRRLGQHREELERRRKERDALSARHRANRRGCASVAS